MSDYYDTLKDGGFYTADLTEEQFLENQQKAYEMFSKGEDYTHSCGICGSITAGYGRLDEYGYWEFPLVVNQKSYAIEDY